MPATSPPASPIGLEVVLGAVRPHSAAAASPARRAGPIPTPVHINGPTLVVVIPEEVNAITGIVSAAGFKGVPKLLRTLGILLLVAL